MHNTLFIFIGWIIGAALVIIFDHVVMPLHIKHHTKNTDIIIFDKYEDAVSVLEKCGAAIIKFGFCAKTLFKIYIKDVTGNKIPYEYDDYRLGWKSIDGVKIKKIKKNHKGYYIDFPVPEELD